MVKGNRAVHVVQEVNLISANWSGKHAADDSNSQTRPNVENATEKREQMLQNLTKCVKLELSLDSLI